MLGIFPRGDCRWIVAIPALFSIDVRGSPLIDGGVKMKLPIRLDHFLQRSGLAQTGGHAKLLIQDGEVFVNGEQEQRRRKMLVEGDVVLCDGRQVIVSTKG